MLGSNNQFNLSEVLTPQKVAEKKRTLSNLLIEECKAHHNNRGEALDHYLNSNDVSFLLEEDGENNSILSDALSAEYEQLELSELTKFVMYLDWNYQYLLGKVIVQLTKTMAVEDFYQKVDQSRSSDAFLLLLTAIKIMSKHRNNNREVNPFEQGFMSHISRKRNDVFEKQLCTPNRADANGLSPSDISMDHFSILRWEETRGVFSTMTVILNIAKTHSPLFLAIWNQYKNDFKIEDFKQTYSGKLPFQQNLINQVVKEFEEASIYYQYRTNLVEVALKEILIKFPQLLRLRDLQNLKIYESGRIFNSFDDMYKNHGGPILRLRDFLNVRNAYLDNLEVFESTLYPSLESYQAALGAINRMAIRAQTNGYPNASYDLAVVLKAQGKVEEYFSALDTMDPKSPGFNEIMNVLAMENIGAACSLSVADIGEESSLDDRNQYLIQALTFALRIRDDSLKAENMLIIAFLYIRGFQAKGLPDASILPPDFIKGLDPTTPVEWCLNYFDQTKERIKLLEVQANLNQAHQKLLERKRIVEQKLSRKMSAMMLESQPVLTFERAPSNPNSNNNNNTVNLDKNNNTM